MSAVHILILGSGMVAGPCIDRLLRNPRNKLTIACRTISTAGKLAANRPNTTAISLDVSVFSELVKAVAEHDLAISLVPFVHHVNVIRAGIHGKTNVVTTSYISPEMRQLESEIKTAGITVLNEVGLDPGIDHLYAIKTISEVHAQGGKIKEFHSYCGGLCAPEHSDNPLRFKFSWSPRGALLSQYNPAAFLKEGRIEEVPRELLMSRAEPYHIIDGYSFVAYPNRNSVPFREAYGIPEAETVIRGTLRYEGNPALVQALIRIGWLDAEPTEWLQEGMSWAEIQARLVGANGSDERSIISRIEDVCQFQSEAERDIIISGLRWIGVFSNDPASISDTPVDTLCGKLATLLSYGPGERDLVILQHKFMIEWQDGATETRTSTLEMYGDPDGYSAMGKSVGVTCAIATELLLEGHPNFAKPGIWAPYTTDMCTPIREALIREGIELVEKKL
ncbi:Saccharopine dehydrogenase [Xylariales sp. PMI_506]|nr:Saccharopine dehydrogenase [Xylariales sp. PMI_506]